MKAKGRFAFSKTLHGTTMWSNLRSYLRDDEELLSKLFAHKVNEKHTNSISILKRLGLFSLCYGRKLIALSKLGS